MARRGAEQWLGELRWTKEREAAFAALDARSRMTNADHPPFEFIWPAWLDG